MNKITGVLIGLLLFPAVSFASVNVTLQGANPDSVRINQVYVDPGYNAFSSTDGDITGDVNYTDTHTNTGFERNYSVTDSNLDTANASRNILVIANGGDGMPWCSGPLAPGYNVSLPHGGCYMPLVVTHKVINIHNPDGSWTAQ